MWTTDGTPRSRTSTAFWKTLETDLGRLTNATLREFGSSLAFYHGLPEFFDNMKAVVAEHQISRPSIEFYIISGGLEEIIRSSAIAKYMDGIWGCRFAEGDGQIRAVMNVVSFTEKTKYLYAINKGVQHQVREHPYAVNNRVAPEDRRIPWSNMIYVGDGLTDVPCFSLRELAAQKHLTHLSDSVLDEYSEEAE